MTNLKQENIRFLLSQYKFNFDVENYKDNDLYCILCKNVPFDVYQSYCGCIYCFACITEYLSKDKVFCIGGKEECKDEYLHLDVNVHKNSVLDRKVLKASIVCPHESCTHSANLAQMEEHLRICTKQSIECPYVSIGCDSNKAAKDKILNHLHNETLPHTQLLVDLIHNLRNELDVLKGRFKEKENRILALEQDFLTKKEQSEKQQEEIEELKKIIEGAEIRINKQDTEIASFRTKNIDYNSRASIDELSNRIGQIDIRTNTTGEILFGVYGFDSIRKTVNYLWSPYFYSHMNGYKLRLQVYPGGYKSGSGTHLSVFIQICTGEYDDILSWPCKYVFTLSVVDRRLNKPPHNEITMSYHTLPDEFKSCFDKPTNVDNISIGDPKYISHYDLMTIEGLMVMNRITIKCTVDSPAKQ